MASSQAVPSARSSLRTLDAQALQTEYAVVLCFVSGAFAPLKGNGAVPAGE